VFAFGLAQPWKPDIPGIEHVPHYADTRAPETYAGKRVFIIGKETSAFELANGFLPWARQIVLASPRPTQLSVVTNSLVGVRARYVQPYEDNIPRRRGDHGRVDRRSGAHRKRVSRVRDTTTGSPS
jgi:cation diffusion facilitator CzcD-associated flavoprotein CzcO